MKYRDSRNLEETNFLCRVFLLKPFLLHFIPADGAAQQPDLLPLVPRGRQLGRHDRRPLRHHGLLLKHSLQARQTILSL